MDSPSSWPLPLNSTSPLPHPFPPITLPSPTPGSRCEVGAEVVTPDLSLFRRFPAPSHPPDLVAGWEVALKVALYVAAAVVTVVGNGVVVGVVVWGRGARSTVNVLLVSQALADLAVAAVCMWVHLGNSLTPQHWPFGHVVCKVNTFCQVAAVTGSTLTLTLLSLERLTAIVFPLRGRWAPATTAWTLALTWTLAVGVACPQLAVRQQREVQWLDRREVWCEEVWTRRYRDTDCHTWQPAQLVYYSVHCIVMYLVPVVIMVAVYSVVTFTLVTRKLPGAVISSTRSAQERAKRKVIKMLIAVLVCFILCWTPQQCLLLYDVFRASHQVPDYLPGVKFGALYLAYINSAVNPLLYGSFNQHFRRGFRHLFRCLGGRLPLNKVHPASGGGGKGAVRGRGGRGGGGRGGDGASMDGGGGAGGATSHTLPLHTLPTVSSRLTSPRQLTARTTAFFGDTDHPHPLPSTSPHNHHHHRPRSLSRPLSRVNFDNTTDIAWHQLHQ